MTGAEVAELCQWIVARRLGLASGAAKRGSEAAAVLKAFDADLAAATRIDGLAAIRTKWAHPSFLSADFGPPRGIELRNALIRQASDIARAILAGDTPKFPIARLKMPGSVPLPNVDVDGAEMLAILIAQHDGIPLTDARSRVGRVLESVRTKGIVDLAEGGPRKAADELAAILFSVSASTVRDARKVR